MSSLAFVLSKISKDLPAIFYFAFGFLLSRYFCRKYAVDLNGIFSSLLICMDVEISLCGLMFFTHGELSSYFILEGVK